jgi:hypothetical protein
MNWNKILHEVKQGGYRGAGICVLACTSGSWVVLLGQRAIGQAEEENDHE